MVRVLDCWSATALSFSSRGSTKEDCSSAAPNSLTSLKNVSVEPFEETVAEIISAVKACCALMVSAKADSTISQNFSVSGSRGHKSCKAAIVSHCD